MITSIRIVIIIVFFVLLISCDVIKENPADSINVPTNSIVLSGTLTEEGGGTLSNAIITVGSISQTTNSSGEFAFGPELTDGTYTLTVSKLGYHTITRNIKINKTSPKNLALSIFKKSSGVVVNATTGGIVAPLSIPANALNATTEISVTNVLGAGIPSLSESDLVIAAYVMEPNGLAFKSPASLQIINPVSGIDISIIKARIGNEELKITTSGENLNVPINHFSEVYFYIPAANFRYRIIDNVKTFYTSKLANCNDTEIIYKDTSVTPRINSLSYINQNILKAFLGLSFTPTSTTLKVTRKLNDPIRQLVYQVNNKQLILELKDANGWKQVADVVIPEITIIPKDIEPCHDQGIIK